MLRRVEWDLIQGPASTRITRQGCGPGRLTPLWVASPTAACAVPSSSPLGTQTFSGSCFKLQLPSRVKPQPRALLMPLPAPTHPLLLLVCFSCFVFLTWRYFFLVSSAVCLEVFLSYFSARCLGLEGSEGTRSVCSTETCLAWVAALWGPFVLSCQALCLLCGPVRPVSGHFIGLVPS